jgi:hypothetical protein
MADYLNRFFQSDAANHRNDALTAQFAPRWLHDQFHS